MKRASADRDSCGPAAPSLSAPLGRSLVLGCRPLCSSRGLFSVRGREVPWHEAISYRACAVPLLVRGNPAPVCAKRVGVVADGEDTTREGGVDSRVSSGAPSDHLGVGKQFHGDDASPYRRRDFPQRLFDGENALRVADECDARVAWHFVPQMRQQLLTSVGDCFAIEPAVPLRAKVVDLVRPSVENLDTIRLKPLPQGCCGPLTIGFVVEPWDVDDLDAVVTLLRGASGSSPEVSASRTLRSGP